MLWGPQGGPVSAAARLLCCGSALVDVLCVGVGAAWGGGRPWLGWAWRRAALREPGVFSLGRAAAVVQPAGACGAGGCVLPVMCLSDGSRCSLLLALPCLLACIACMLRTRWLECSRVAAGSGCWRWSRRVSATARQIGWRYTSLHCVTEYSSPEYGVKLLGSSNQRAQG